MISCLRFVLPLLALAYAAPGVALAQKGKGDSGDTAPTFVIPGGTHSTPFVISQSGSYVLAGNRTNTNPATPVVEINALDVTLDLQGFVLAHPSGSTSTGSIVHLNAAENVEIRNGALVNAALHGVNANSGKTMRLLDLRIVAPKDSGLFINVEDALAERCHVSDAGVHGIVVQGARSIVRDCVVSNVGKYGIFAGRFGRVLGSTSNGAETGIGVNFAGTIADNHVSEARQTAVACGAYTTIRNNQLVNNTRYGIHLHNGQVGVEIVGNNIVNTLDSGGARAGIVTPYLSTVLRDNRLFGNGTNISGVFTDGGGNTQH